MAPSSEFHEDHIKSPTARWWTRGRQVLPHRVVSLSNDDEASLQNMGWLNVSNFMVSSGKPSSVVLIMQGSGPLWPLLEPRSTASEGTCGPQGKQLRRRTGSVACLLDGTECWSRDAREAPSRCRRVSDVVSVFESTRCCARHGSL